MYIAKFRRALYCCLQTKQLDSKYLLRLKDVTPVDYNGNYTCIVSNRLGELRATTQLLVNGQLLFSLLLFSL